MINLSRYFAEVEEARTRLSQLQSPDPSAPFTVVKDHHAHVSEVRRHIKKACRTYRRKTIVSRFILWGEHEAVMLGYMRFDEIDPNP